MLDAASTKKLLDLFYEKLFVLDPLLEKMFTNTHMDEQKKKLGEIITVGITTLNNFPKEVRQALQDLGKRHVKYGVTEKDYDTVGQALVYALKKTFAGILLDENCKDLFEAWIWFYGVVANQMKFGASNA